MMTNGYKFAHCLLLAAVMMFCAGMLPFTPNADDTDENFGRASVQSLVSSQTPAQAKTVDEPFASTAVANLLSQVSDSVVRLASHEAVYASPRGTPQSLPPLRT